MTAQPPTSSDNGAQAAKGFWAESAQSAKAWAAVAATFFAVVTFAFWLFSRHQSERQLQLDAQYSQNAARFAQQLELKYKNYRAVVDNVTRVLSSAGAKAIELRRRAIEYAQQARQRAAASERQLKAQADHAISRKTQAADAAKRYGSATQKANNDTALREQAYAAAEEAVKTSQSLMETANQAFLAAAAELLTKQRELSQAQRAVEAAQTSSPASLLPISTPSPTSTPPPTDKGLLLALAARDAKKNEVEAAREAFEDAQKRATTTSRDAFDRDADAEQAWLELKVSYGTLEPSEQSKGAAAQRGEPSEVVEHASRGEQPKLEQQKKQPDGGSPAASNVSSAIAGDAYLEELEALVLPSHAQQLRQCRGISDVPAVRLCVAQRIAELNDVQGMEIVECSSSSNLPSVGEDGRYLLIPPSGQAPGDPSIPPACGRVRLRRLLSGVDETTGGTGTQTAEGAFDNVLLLRRDGTTLHSLAPGANPRVLALPGFEDRSADASRVLPNVVLGSSQYRAFLQPIRLRLAKPVADSEKAAPVRVSRRT